MARKKFIRRNWDKYSRLGHGRKKKQVWRKSRGRHAKIREARKGYPCRPKIGMANGIKEKIVLIRNMQDLQNTKKGEKAVIAKVGKKLRMIIEKAAKEKGILIVKKRKEK